jgi:hypothetical protein
MELLASMVGKHTAQQLRCTALAGQIGRTQGFEQSGVSYASPRHEGRIGLAAWCVHANCWAWSACVAVYGNDYQQQR